MTREEAKELLPLVTAFANGETIQFYCSGQWMEVAEPSFTDQMIGQYRIKPKPREWWIEKTKQGCISLVNLTEDWIPRPDSEVIKVREVLK